MKRQWYISRNAAGAQRLSDSIAAAHRHAGAKGGVRQLRSNPEQADQGYAVINGKGELEFFTAVENDAVEHAVRGAGTYGTVALDDETSIPLTQNPAGDRITGVPTGERALQLTGLPQVLRKLGYLHGYLTREDIEKWTVESAWQRLKHKLPTGEELAGKASYKPSKSGVNAWQKSASTAVNQLLRQNAKTAKGIADPRTGGVAQVYVSAGLSLAPHQVGLRGIVYDARGRADYADLSEQPQQVTLKSSGSEIPGQFTLCAGSSAQCRQTCLAYSGHNPVNDYSYICKVKLTEALYEEPAAFMRLLLEAIRKHFWKFATKNTYAAKKSSLLTGVESENVDDEDLEQEELSELGMAMNPKGKDATVMVPAVYHPRVRLNVYQDIPWDVLCPSLLDIEWLNQRPDTGRPRPRPANAPLGIMYDYTKNLRESSEVLDITFSCTGERANMNACDQMLQMGTNVAVVFVGATSEESGLEPAKTGGRPLKKFSRDEEIQGKQVKVYPWKLRFVPTGRHWPVINGDESDIRDQDPKGFVVGLTYKVPMVRYELSEGAYAKRMDEYARVLARWTKKAEEAKQRGEAEPKMPSLPSNYGLHPAVAAKEVDKFVVRVLVGEVFDEATQQRKKVLLTTHNPNQSHVLIS